jgi:hypothetical protein
MSAANIKVLSQDVDAANALLAEIQTLERMKADMLAKVKSMQARAKGVSLKVYTAKSSGDSGIVMNGFGKPVFFYKEHLLRLVGDTEEAELIRKQCREWIQANDAVLTNPKA